MPADQSLSVVLTEQRMAYQDAKKRYGSPVGPVEHIHYHSRGWRTDCLNAHRRGWINGWEGVPVGECAAGEE